MSETRGKDNQRPEWYENQVGSYALDALSSEEKVDFEAHLAVTPHLQDELRTLRIGVKAYALVPEERAPSADLRGRLFAAISAEPNFVSSTQPVRTIEPPVSLVDFKAVRGWVISPTLGKIAATLTVVIVGSLIAWNFSLRGDNDDLKTDVGQLQNQVNGQMLAQFGPFDPTSTAPATGEVRYLPESDIFALAFQDLPELTGDQVYQLWFLIGSDAPIPSLTFRQGNAPDGSTTVAVVGDPNNFDAFAISVEPGPVGSLAPTDIILAAAV